MSGWARRVHRGATTLSSVVTACGYNPPYTIRMEKVKFGCPLEETCRVHGDIPGPLLVLVLCINKLGPLKRDVFRAPGHQGNVKKLTEFLEQGRLVNLDKFSVHTLASVLKKFLRKIPGGVFGSTIESALLEAIQNESLALEDKRDLIAQIIASLPVLTQRLLVLICGTLRTIASASDANRMNAEALGVSVAPSFFRTCDGIHKTARMEDIVKFKNATRAMRFLIEQFGSSNIYGRDNYEYYARMTGRALRVDGGWIFADRYPFSAHTDATAMLLGRAPPPLEISEGAGDDDDDDDDVGVADHHARQANAPDAEDEQVVPAWLSSVPLSGDSSGVSGRGRRRLAAGGSSRPDRGPSQRRPLANANAPTLSSCASTPILDLSGASQCEMTTDVMTACYGRLSVSLENTTLLLAPTLAISRASICCGSSFCAAAAAVPGDVVGSGSRSSDADACTEKRPADQSSASASGEHSAFALDSPVTAASQLCSDLAGGVFSSGLPCKLHQSNVSPRLTLPSAASVSSFEAAAGLIDNVAIVEKDDCLVKPSLSHTIPLTNSVINDIEIPVNDAASVNKYPCRSEQQLHRTQQKSSQQSQQKSCQEHESQIYCCAADSMSRQCDLPLLLPSVAPHCMQSSSTVTSARTLVRMQVPAAGKTDGSFDHELTASSFGLLEQPKVQEPLRRNFGQLEQHHRKCQDGHEDLQSCAKPEHPHQCNAQWPFFLRSHFDDQPASLSSLEVQQSKRGNTNESDVPADTGCPSHSRRSADPLCLFQQSPVATNVNPSTDIMICTAEPIGIDSRAKSTFACHSGRSPDLAASQLMRNAPRKDHNLLDAGSVMTMLMTMPHSHTIGGALPADSGSNRSRSDARIRQRVASREDVGGSSADSFRRRFIVAPHRSGCSSGDRPLSDAASVAAATDSPAVVVVASNDDRLYGHTNSDTICSLLDTRNDIDYNGVNENGDGDAYARRHRKRPPGFDQSQWLLTPPSDVLRRRAGGDQLSVATCRSSDNVTSAHEILPPLAVIHKSMSFLPQVHERQTERMRTRSEWFLNPLSSSDISTGHQGVAACHPPSQQTSVPFIEEVAASEPILLPIGCSKETAAPVLRHDLSVPQQSLKNRHLQPTECSTRSQLSDELTDRRLPVALENDNFTVWSPLSGSPSLVAAAKTSLAGRSSKLSLGRAITVSKVDAAQIATKTPLPAANMTEGIRSDSLAALAPQPLANLSNATRRHHPALPPVARVASGSTSNDRCTLAGHASSQCSTVSPSSPSNLPKSLAAAGSNSSSGLSALSAASLFVGIERSSPSTNSSSTNSLATTTSGIQRKTSLKRSNSRKNKENSSYGAAKRASSGSTVCTSSVDSSTSATTRQ